MAKGRTYTFYKVEKDIRSQEYRILSALGRETEKQIQFKSGLGYHYVILKSKLEEHCIADSEKEACELFIAKMQVEEKMHNRNLNKSIEARQQVEALLGDIEERLAKIKSSMRADEEVIETIKKSPYNFNDTRWAAYQNKAFDSSDFGRLTFLAIGPDNTFKSAPESSPDSPDIGTGWKYRFTGWLNTNTGIIKEESWEQQKS